MNRSTNSFPLRTTLLFLLFGSLWILLSDRILFFFIPDPAQYRVYQTFKGWFFVFASGLLLYFLLGREFTIRRRTQNALDTSERQIANIVESAMDGIISIDCDQHIILMNPAAEQMFGYQNGELLGQPLDALIPKSALKTHRQRVEDFGRTGATRRSSRMLGEIRGVHANGVEFPIEASISNIRVGAQIVYTVILRDITERKQAEEKIQRQLKYMNALREIDRAITSSFDLQVSLNTLISRTIQILEVDAALVLLLNPVTSTLEFAAGSGFWSESVRTASIRLGDSYAGRVAVDRQIVQIPDLARETRNLFQIGFLDNECFAGYYGAPLIVKGKVIGVLEVFHRSVVRHKNEWLDIFDTLAGQAAIAIDQAQMFDGLQRSNIQLEHRVAERTAELNQKNLELEHANRAKDEFLAIMSHELRTPLNSILGLSETLLEQRRDTLSESQQKSLQIIEASGHHLLELINDVLDLSKIEAGKFDYYPQIVEVDVLCRSSLAFVRQQATRKSIHIEFEGDPEISSIYADPRRMKQILVNLLTNAVKFTPERGQVKLQTLFDSKNGRIQFIVSDTGIGIDRKDMGKLFHPFSQIDSSLTREFEGTGLGLALVQRLTDLHGGSVEVESEPGRGSRFTVNLPWMMELVQHPKGLETSKRLPDSPQPHAGQIQGRILLAEDNDTNVLTIGEYLESHAFEVVNAPDGLLAIEMTERTNPDLILMDIQMPALDGLEAIRRLRQNPRFASTPIIALTALAMPGDRERCLEAGANEYMSKPVSLKSLVTTIHQLLGNPHD